MIAELEYREQTLMDFDLGMLGGVKLDYENGVFRRYHVNNNPLNYTDPFGLAIQFINTDDPGSHIAGLPESEQIGILINIATGQTYEVYHYNGMTIVYDPHTGLTTLVDNRFSNFSISLGELRGAM